MFELFDKYVEENQIETALLVGKNLFNKDPSNPDFFKKYYFFLLNLAQKLPAIEERKFYLNQADITLAFFIENVDVSEEILELIAIAKNDLSVITNDINTQIKNNEETQITQISNKNNDLLKKLFNLKDELKTVKDQAVFEQKMSDINAIDTEIEKDFLTKEQNKYYDALTKDFTSLISEKMKQLEYKNNISYNNEAIKAYKKAFDSFRKDEAKYKNDTQLFELASKTLFAYDASKLFNETLIYYNHVYSYIFSKLDDNGKYELTRFSIECERKLR